MSKHSRNAFEGAVWAVILCFLSFGTAFLHYTGRSTLFLESRFMPLLVITVPAALILAAVSLHRPVVRLSSPQITSGFLVFVFPVVLGAVAFSSRAEQTGGFGAPLQTASLLSGSQPELPVPGRSQTVQSEPDSQIPEDERTLAQALSAQLYDRPALPAEGAIVLTSDNYYQYYNEIYEDLESFIGREITVSGFVHREAEFTSSEFLVARLMMWCCAADTAMLGFVANSEGIPVPHDETWIKATGTLESRAFYNRYTDTSYEIPALRVRTLERIGPPEFEYVFPF